MNFGEFVKYNVKYINNIYKEAKGIAQTDQFTLLSLLNVINSHISMEDDIYSL